MLISRRVDVKSKVSKDYIAFRSPLIRICIPRVPLYVWLTKGLQTADHSVVFFMLFLEHAKLWGLQTRSRLRMHKWPQVRFVVVILNFIMDEWIQREDLTHGVQLQTLIHQTIFKLIWVQWSLYVQCMYRKREQAVSVQLPTIWNIRWIIKYGTLIRGTTKKKGKSKIKRVTKTCKLFCCALKPRSNLSCSKLSGCCKLHEYWLLIG